jgi:hypothetical protein
VQPSLCTARLHSQLRYASPCQDKLGSICVIRNHSTTNVEVALYGESRGGECGFEDFREKTLQNEHSEDDIVEFWDNICSLKSFLRLTTQMHTQAAAKSIRPFLERLNN